jgi:hypothetical protein
VDYIFFFVLIFFNKQHFDFSQITYIFVPRKQLITSNKMNYNKKQMQPLIDKYQINPEVNKLFANIIEMFDGQPNYQIWAVKGVFSHSMTIEELSLIHSWLEKNQTMIKNLEKKNIVSYSGRQAILQLQKEMRGIDMLNIIKDVISHFNTDQRKILTDSIVPTDIAPLAAFNSGTITKWADIFSKFSRLPSFRKNNFYTKASGIRDASTLQALIIECLEGTYTWNKEDMIAFLENNAKDCEIVFNQGPYVIVHVPTFESSKKLCGGGRTQWCITMEPSHWRDYVCCDGNNNSQYFLFDFTRKETDCFAHIGFTIKKGSGIIYAQTCDNQEMIDDFTSQSGETLNIHSALAKIGADTNTFIKLPKNKEFEWVTVSLMEYVNKNSNLFSIAYEKDNRVIVNILSYGAVDRLINHTMINTDILFVGENNKLYVLLDFNLPYNNENAVISMSYSKDLYGSFSANEMYNTFGKNITKDKYLETIGIHESDYLNCEKVDSGVLLHKFIDSNDEEGAIKLIEESGDNFNVNYEFQMRLPVFSAANKKMSKLFDVIVKHPSFELSHEDGFGDTILQTLLLIYDDETVKEKEDESVLRGMIKSIIESRNLDFNGKDINYDTAINISCASPALSWVTEELVKIKSVDINYKNDVGLSPLASAIMNNNMPAIIALGKRPDLVIGIEEKKLAKSHGIDLEKYINPTENVFFSENLLEEAERLLKFAMSGSF